MVIGGTTTSISKPTSAGAARGIAARRSGETNLRRNVPTSGATPDVSVAARSSFYSRSVEVASAPAASDESPPAGSTSSAPLKREKAKSVAKGEATWYMPAVPSMAPSAIADVAMRPDSG